ncbi:MAG: CPBP family intramembrane metalloprotease [Ruminococcaceae bacterium]|nr:CPBP family intramembrane metalloprotease [Oscillospiraceae bacterium]
MRTVFQGEHFTDEVRSAQRKPHPLLMILIFIVILAVSQLVPMAIEIPLGRVMSRVFEDSQALYSGFMTGISLILTAVGIITAILYCRLIERRSLAGMGLVRGKCVRYYVLGAALGTMMFSASVGICVITGAVRYIGTDVYSAPIFVLICVGWLIQGAEEEILCRGLLMGSLCAYNSSRKDISLQQASLDSNQGDIGDKQRQLAAARMPLWGAVLINSVFFAVLHVFNGGFNPIAFVNLTLFRLFMSVMALRFNSIIPCCAAHSLWNLAQGNIFGLPVSGATSGPSVWRFELLPDMALWTGGEFGIEGGLGTTAVLAVMTACLMFSPAKNDKQ